MWKLVIEDDESNRTVVPLTRDQGIRSVGAIGNTIRLTERNVSRDHARLAQARYERGRKQRGPAGQRARARPPPSPFEGSVAL